MGRGVRGPGKSSFTLRLFAWLFFLWMYVPLLVAIRVSVTEGDLGTDPRGFSLQWYRSAFVEKDIRDAMINSVSLALLTVVIATPLGTALAIGLSRWRSRASTAIKGTVLLALGVPQIALSTALFILIASVFTFMKFGSTAQLFAHVTLAIPFVVVIVLSRLRMIGGEYEEMALDLGASPLQSVRMVILPLLTPSIVVAAAVAFVLSYDNIVLSQQLCIERKCGTIPVVLYGGGRVGSPGPRPYALATIGLGFALVVIALAWRGFRLLRARTQLRPSSR